jgi:hypothetical protein
MDTAKLIEKLLEIEVSVGRVNTLAVQAMLRDAEDIALSMDYQLIQLLEENELLKQQMERIKRSSLHRLSKPSISDAELEAMDGSKAERSRLKQDIDPFTIN